MIDDTLEKRGQLQLIRNQPLRLVEKVKSTVSGSTKAVKRDNSKVLPTQSPSSRPKTASDPHFREGVTRDNSKVPPAQPSSSRPKTALDPHFRGVKRDNSKVLPAQQSSSRPKIASDPHFREGVKRDNSKFLPAQPSSSRPKIASDPHVLNREGVKRDNSKLLSTQPSSSRPKTASDPHLYIREGVRPSSVPSSSTSAKGWPTATPAPRKRPSDTPDSAMKRQKMGKYLGCPICGGPHHLVKDCPITAEGPKRYFFLVSDFMTSLLITSWIVYALQSCDWSLNRGKLLLSLLSVTF
jgi:hypothetical protein